ncbi:MarR family transcriptional regulator [Luteimonas sp. BDR2-5]|uniref:MarR family winged helix-turn-helix transcriptional regulator n=1 Tax=Proluteimonas luteida TaxID=2878685 RepID=UPI001E5D8E81|nr:MarR family transcriptional regulator [Luteimonas sp. BDR2-5]MCD9028234.1 MarR family transcriptional regulator [Luteimonas sp. BDR2-5]
MPSSSATAGDARPHAPVFPCSCHRLRKLTRLMTQRYDHALAPAGINVNQYAILRRAGQQPRPVGELAAALGMDRSTLSRDLKHLTAAGWARLAPSKTDARQRLVELTPSGRRVLGVAEPLWRDAQLRIERQLGLDGVAHLHAALDHATRTLTA